MSEPEVGPPAAPLEGPVPLERFLRPDPERFARLVESLRPDGGRALPREREGVLVLIELAKAAWQRMIERGEVRRGADGRRVLDLRVVPSRTTE